MRIRDLVHGFVYLTELEVHAINHPLFQRLRHIRQNDVAASVYPSLNTSRFEHSIGCTHVAGKMAANLVRSPKWREYKDEVGLARNDFEQVCRLYALLHDLGHLPLSHLFELAFEKHAGNVPLPKLCKEWFGGEGFTKLHEACGYAAAQRLLKDINAPTPVSNPVLYLMRNKVVSRGDSLRPIKLLIDSEIDADRIDSTRRDGQLAGGEYGSYDIERLCSAVFLTRCRKEWRLAYSHKALGSMESLLLDRYRTHTWIHFHHQVVAMKIAVRELIGRLLGEGIISAKSFPTDDPRTMCLRDDVWLWSLLRDMPIPSSDKALVAVRDVAIYRDMKPNLMLLWKHRSQYTHWRDRVLEASQKRTITKFNSQYEDVVSKKLGVKVLCLWLSFGPTGNNAVPLTSENGDDDLGDLMDSSALIRSLSGVWAHEPQGYVALFGEIPKDTDSVREAWVQATAEWLCEKPE
jgi:HD superfamily phosphohydrolase